MSAILNDPEMADNSAKAGCIGMGIGLISSVRFIPLSGGIIFGGIYLGTALLIKGMVGSVFEKFRENFSSKWYVWTKLLVKNIINITISALITNLFVPFSIASALFLSAIIIAIQLIWLMVETFSASSQEEVIRNFSKAPILLQTL